uniref:Secretory carrier-associated membrane protein n=1 Tax=Monodelphis domestica TaxID=13616 RepID=A0A5F8HEZ4_MONDO
LSSTAKVYSSETLLLPDFSDEIPIDHQFIVKRIYHLWIFYSITLVVNLIACLAWWIAGGDGVNFGLAILWLLLFTPCSYVCWFRPAYKAFSGWWSTIFFFKINVAAAVFMIFPAIMFTLSAAMMCVILVRVHRFYRGSGGSLQKAQDEWSSGNWRNPPSREAQFNNFSGTSLPEYPTVPNYPSGSHWP